MKIVTNVDRFSPADIGDSDKVKRGQPIIVIGNPLGERYAHSVLTGIVSGKDRQRGLLQLSIPTYTGISGSPVFDSQGQVVAVMVAGPNRWEKQAVVTQQKVQEVGVRTSAEGIGLAIPINHARGILGILSK